MNTGSLVIVGGALKSSNALVYQKFIELAGGNVNARIGILPAASMKPVGYGAKFKADLIRYGVPADQIELIEIAPRVPDNIEDNGTRWIENAEKQEVAEVIRTYSGIWFLGGDQTQITKVLWREDGRNTAALDAIWEVYRSGGVIGGISAGAAIMSEVMISGGDSLGALTFGVQEKTHSLHEPEIGAVVLTKGLGFFPYGIVDQHFDRQARLGRLLVAAYARKATYPLGFGIDEDTALVVYNDQKMAEVFGNGVVTLINVSETSRDTSGQLPSFRNILLSVMAVGDRYDLETGEISVNPLRARATTVGHEFSDMETLPMVTGVFSRNALLKHFITYDLLDNKNARTARSYCFGPDGIGFELNFRQIENSKCYWGYIDGLADTYSAINVALDIIPVNVEITTMN